jgi:hypothetical protein
MPESFDAPLARLLVVDDQAELIEMLGRRLRRLGYSVTAATSGEQALEILRTAAAAGTDPFDVMLSDLKMPGMDGIELLRAVGRIDGDLVSVVMTGHGTVGAAVEAMKAGAHDFISKPSDLEEVEPVLARALTVRKLRSENTGLMRQIASRTSEIESVNRELQAANEELEAFVHSVSHDLSQPLGHMMGFSEVLMSERHGSLNAKQREFLQDIYRGGVSLQRLIADLLKFSRFSRQPLEKRPVDMVRLVREVVAPLRTASPERIVGVAIGALPQALADPALLTQVMANLLSNAFKFTRQSTAARIEVTGEVTGDGVSYCVRDNGVGFDSAEAPRLFSIFQRLHSDSEFEGNGVGLSIVQRIVERHGGKVSAHSEPGRGAAFSFTLPS